MNNKAGSTTTKNIRKSKVQSTEKPQATVAATGSTKLEDKMKFEYTKENEIDTQCSLSIAASKIAPLWPLDNWVAVNPYFGLADTPFDQSAHLLAALSGAKTTMQAQYYLDKIDNGEITLEDITIALNKNSFAPTRQASAFVKLVQSTSSKESDDALAFGKTISLVSDVASQVSGKDWSRFKVDQVSSWASCYFDQGQSIWPSVDRKVSPFISFKQHASIDKTPEIMGLKNFRNTIKFLPDNSTECVAMALNELGIEQDSQVKYLHALLLSVGGWAAHASRIVFEQKQLENQDNTLAEFTAILVAFELAIARFYRSTNQKQNFNERWASACNALKAGSKDTESHTALNQRLILQDAFDISTQRKLIDQFAQNSSPDSSRTEQERKDLQAIFCIDVRSEVFRRNLETVSENTATIGFAGFFGFPADHVKLGHTHGQAQCPVLLTTGFTSNETTGDATLDAQVIEIRSLKHHVRRAWKSFKMGAITCFSFVGPVGLIYFPKLVTDSLGITRPVAKPDIESLPKGIIGKTAPSIAHIPLQDRTAMAKGALQGMSLTKNFAKFILISGHGSSTVNNPYGTGLDCGACGGNTGEQTARIAASILNDPAVRKGLIESSIEIPYDTVFVAGLHDTTTDEVSLFDTQNLNDEQTIQLEKIKSELSQAGRLSRVERSSRLGILSENADIIESLVKYRSRDWSQVRPEWGLAGCKAFIAAPRNRSELIDLGGRSFLHSYNWREDKDFSVLNLIMTAPIVVASWINLQYYASSVETEIFGSGNKTLHNVVGRLGVLEGNSGDLRVGLPFQSVHDGTELQHEPLRLNVVLEAPMDAINNVFKANELVQNLFDNEWLYLFVLNEDGKISNKYEGNLNWKKVGQSTHS